MHVTCIREVPGSSIDWDIQYSDVFRGLSYVVSYLILIYLGRF
jgi:hypothetical protein